MNSKIILLILFFAIPLAGRSGNALPTRVVYKSQNKLEFPGAGEYLTEDKYLLIGKKITHVINRVKYTDTIKSVSSPKKGKVLNQEKSYEAEKLRITVKLSEDLRKKAGQRIDEYLKKKYCIDNNIKSSFPKDAPPEYVLRVDEKNKEIGKQIEALNILTKDAPKTHNMESVTHYNYKIKWLMKEIDSGFTEICTTEKNFCGCYSG